ncbi:hypothetical protein H4R35_001301 [Dimargaris xerosporica]|nr:hypothetical protein H4R35_001301 [Dimargaris xerosporica]
MARITLWLLTAMAAVSLIHATQVPVESDSIAGDSAENTPKIDEQEGAKLFALPTEMLDHMFSIIPLPKLHLFKSTSKKSQQVVQNYIDHRNAQIFAKLRQLLDLRNLQQPPNLVGLHTLLDGAQLEYRGTTSSFLAYFYFSKLGDTGQLDNDELHFPDLFNLYRFRDLVLPEFVEPWIDVTFSQDKVSPNWVKHGLINLGRKPDVSYIVDVVEAVLEVLHGSDLLTNFRTIAGLPAQEQQDDQSTGSDSQTLMATVPEQPMDFPTFMHRFWATIIGGNDIHKLRFFLINLLAFNVIPGIIAQTLESNKHPEALKLATRISQLPRFISAAKAFTTNAPNYFEFIVMYVIERQLNEHETIIRDVQQNGKGRTNHSADRL